MPEIIKDERKVIRRDGKLIFVLNQEQIYEDVTRTNMLAAWRKELSEKEEWVRKFDDILKSAKEQTEVELNTMKEKIVRDIEHIKEGIAIWSEVQGEMDHV